MAEKIKTRRHHRHAARGTRRIESAIAPRPKAEVKQEWEQLERKSKHLEARFDSFGNEAKASAGEVAASLRQVAAELDKAYKRLKKSWR